MKQNYQFTAYFLEQVMRKRPYLTQEYCVQVLENPLAEIIQINRRRKYWGFVKELNKIIRVVTLEDGRTIHNAFIDRGFKWENQS